MIPTPSMFSTDPGKIFDFSGKRPADIFNESILPKLSALDSDMGLEEAAQRRQQQLATDLDWEASRRQEDDAFLSELMQNRQQPAQPDLGEYAVDLPEYDRPVTPSAAPSSAPPQSNEPLGARDVGMPASKNLTDFVKHFEGFNPKAYGDFKQTSIGYGTRAKKGEISISKEEAEKRLAQELAVARQQVELYDKKYGYKFSDNEKDALTSFTYNVGNLKQLTADGSRDKATIAAKILEYNKAGGKVLKGLAKRRQAEHNLFTKGY